jgi:hypothetical protein
MCTIGGGSEANTARVAFTDFEDGHNLPEAGGTAARIWITADLISSMSCG